MYWKPSKEYIINIKNKKKPQDIGKIFFQHKSINWSNLYLGNIALTIINWQATNINLNIKKKETPIKKVKFLKKKKGNQPPKKKITNIAEFNNILVYSPKKNKAKFIAEYSKL